MKITPRSLSFVLLCAVVNAQEALLRGSATAATTATSIDSKFDEMKNRFRSPNIDLNSIPSFGTLGGDNDLFNSNIFKHDNDPTNLLDDFLGPIGRSSSTDMNIRFNKIPLIDDLTPLHVAKRLPLKAVDYPISLKDAEWLRETGAISVFIEQDCTECTLSPRELIRASRVKVTHPSSDSNSTYWDELREVIKVQIARINGEPVKKFMKLPAIWKGYNMSEVAEAVHDEYPGSIHVELIKTLFGGHLDRTYRKNCPNCVQVDRSIIPSKSKTEFIRGVVMLSDINTFAFGLIGPINFSVKWYVGRCRPEEIVWQIYTNKVTAKDGVPSDIVRLIKNFNLTDMREFTAYEEGCPEHPSWPAMHSASSAASLWMAVVLNLNTEQWCEVKAVDYAISYARTVAGVHYPSDNIAGLNIGQHIMASKLPEHLSRTYDSHYLTVVNKISRVRFDWNDYLTSECFA